jgi:hypothetical protein
LESYKNHNQLVLECDISKLKIKDDSLV